jgi:hypothetical protein
VLTSNRDGALMFEVERKTKADPVRSQIGGDQVVGEWIAGRVVNRDNPIVGDWCCDRSLHRDPPPNAKQAFFFTSRSAQAADQFD